MRIASDSRMTSGSVSTECVNKDSSCVHAKRPGQSSPTPQHVRTFPPTSHYHARLPLCLRACFRFCLSLRGTAPVMSPCALMALAPSSNTGVCARGFIARKRAWRVGRGLDMTNLPMSLSWRRPCQCVVGRHAHSQQRRNPYMRRAAKSILQCCSAIKTRMDGMEPLT